LLSKASKQIGQRTDGAWPPPMLYRTWRRSLPAALRADERWDRRFRPTENRM